jgi:ketosteroid isomerase-like protein
MNIAIKSQDKTKVLSFVTEDFFSVGNGRISINSKATFSKALDSQIESAALNPTDGFFAKVKSIIKVDISTNAASVIALIVTKEKEGESRINEKNVVATFYLVKQNSSWKISNEHCSTSK